MSELLDFQAKQIEALRKELALVRKELAELTKKIEVNDPIILGELERQENIKLYKELTKDIPEEHLFDGFYISDGLFLNSDGTFYDSK
jgi:hypothetical protein